MNLVLLNQFFPPAQAPTGLLLADLAAELAGRGHAVTVITSASGYGAEAGPEAEASAGVRVIRTGDSVRHQNQLAAKLGDYLAFARSAGRELTRLPEKTEALVCMTTPPFLGLFAAQLRKRHGIPYALWCMDLYPEALAAHGWLRRWNPLWPLLKNLARIERQNAARVIALGPDMAELLTATGATHIDEIPVWSSLDPAPAVQTGVRELRRARGWADDEVVLLYSGNMGRAHRAGEFAALAERLRENNVRCRFVFSGGGPAREEWVRRWAGRFEFMPPVSGADCAAHLLAADVHLVSQQPEWQGVVVPSKFQAACALGRPVVFAGPQKSAVGRWLAEADAGWGLPPDDSAAIESAASGLADAAVRAEKGANAARLFAQRFTKALCCAILADRIESMVDPDS